MTATPLREDNRDTYLRSLGGKNGGREVIATVFTGVDSRMRSGYLLRDVIDKIGSIHFNSTEELAASILEKERCIAEIVGGIQQLLKP